MAKRRRLKKTVARKVRLIVIAFFFILSCVLYNRVFLMNIVPTKYLKLLLLGLLLINFVAIFLFMFRSKICKLVGFLLYVLLFTICTVGIRYSNITLRFLNKAFQTKREIVIYDVVVPIDSHYNEIKDLDNKTMGILSMDSNDYVDSIKKEISITTESYDLFTFYNSFISNNVESAVINHSYLELLDQEYPDFKDTYKSIYTFDIELESERVEKEVKSLRPITIYITGLDSRSGKIESIGLSDVNMLVTINPHTNTILLTGIPRDYYVQLHGTTGLKDKLTHAGTLGVNMSKTTVEDLFNIKIDYSVKVGFNSLIDIVDLIGGIDIESDTDFWSFHYDGWHVRKGINHMDGEHALAYARERYAYSDGDEHRVRNQQQVFTAVFNKIVKDKKMLIKYDILLDELSDLYSTDIPKSYVTLLIKQQLNDFKSWDITTQSVTGEIKTAECYSLPGKPLVVLEPDMKSVETAKSKIEEVLNK